MKYFVGFSDEYHQDIRYYQKTFEGRMPNDLFVIAPANDEGDLVCMNKKDGNIYFWDHEVNDWGIENNDLWSLKISNSLTSFISSLKSHELPSEKEIEKARSEGKIKFISPIGLQLLNKDREKRGLAPLTMEQASKGV